MPNFLSVAGTLGLLSIAFSLFAQDRVEDGPIVPKATPIEENDREEVVEPERIMPAEEEDFDPSTLDINDIPRALPIEKDIPRAKPVAAEELERLQREREERWRAAEEESMRLKRERAIAAAGTARDERAMPIPREADEPDFANIPRALPIGKSPVMDQPKPEREPGLSPMDVASRKAPDEPTREPEKAASKLKAEWMTRTDARSFTMLIPAPRGPIVDRWGQPLVQNKVANILAIKLPYLDDTTEREVLSYARTRIDLANRILAQDWQISDEAIIKHFKNRRWLPLMFSSALTPWQEETIEPHLDKGLIKFPTYVRHYPQKKLAAHIVGYAGKTRRLPTGPVVSGDPLFPQIEGRDGLEISFDADLQGTPGVVNYLFGSDGTELDREITRRPIPGSTVVTTLDLEMQQLAEEILENSVKRGAFVVMNINTGEILTMASFPAFDPNDFSPSISQDRFDELQNDPEIPLFARAFRASYPPASTFKIITGLAALESGAITEQTLFPCPPVMMIDSRPFRNWNKKAEDDMNIVVAIARSCNPFFFKAGLKTGGDNLSSMGYRFGYGQKTGIKLFGEEDGFMPSQSNMRERGKNLSGGHLANASIGQGDMLATPLQVCQMMAGIANGRAIPQARLVMQVQDHNNQVVKHFPAVDKNLLNVEKNSLDVIRRGMAKVVNASWGTGKAASNYYVTLAGKTGTGQWGPSADKRYLAWFAGFVPYENPEYAFAVLYEGDKGETIGGGRIAAPLAGRFFNAVYQKKKDGGLLAGYERSSDASSDGRSGGSSSSNNQPQETTTGTAEPAEPPEETKEKKLRGFFNRFNRGRN
ncbi:MAG: penicillin-binding protein 2 [Verrucomicrobiales bacterium]|jgi:penicillin-binding protein 2